MLPSTPTEKELDLEFENWIHIRLLTVSGRDKLPEAYRGIFDSNEYDDISKDIHKSVRFSLLHDKFGREKILDNSDKWRAKIYDQSPEISTQFYKTVPKLLRAIQFVLTPDRHAFLEKAIEKLGEYTIDATKKDEESAEEFLHLFSKYLKEWEPFDKYGDQVFELVTISDIVNISYIYE